MFIKTFSIHIMKKFAVLLIAILLIPATGNGFVKLKINENEVEQYHQIYFSDIQQNDSIYIIHPRLSHPVIVEKNSNFTIILSSPSFDSIEIKITTAYNPMPDCYILQPQKIWNKGAWHIVVNSGNAAYELYNLTISLTINGNRYLLNEPKAVAIEKIDGNFTFIHLTDLHIGDPRGAQVSIKETMGWKAARKVIEEINLLHPSFVIITGDLVFGQLYPFEYTIEYKKLYEILQKFDVPIFLCPGNHDGYVQCGQDGFKLWEKYFGWLNYSFDYGNAHFVMANSYEWPYKSRMAISYAAINWGGYVMDEQLKWIEKDLKKSNAELKILALHHNPLWDTSNDSLLHNPYYNREKLLHIIWSNGVDAVLDGHVHYDDIEKVNGTLFITTTTAASSLSSSDAYWGYRLIDVKNWSIVSYNYKEPKFSIPSYHINYTMEKYGAMIENDLDMDIKALVSFYVENRSFSVENGEIVMERYKGENKEIYVKVNVPANSKIEIRLE